MRDSVSAPRAAWWMWGLGLAAYVVAVFNRASLGVAGLQAQQRLGAAASALALFAVLQLAVYAGMQVPVGVLLDRFGPRRMVVSGAVLMAAGQLALALAQGVPAALGARVLVGAGDAMTFISVLRLVPAWFPSRRVPLVTQLTGILGQLGQVAAALPLVVLLRTAGWSASYAGAAAVTVLVGVVVAAALREQPPGTHVHRAAVGLGEVRAGLRDAWREPGTRLGYWTHFTTQFSGTVFVLLWGYPFLVAGEGRSPTEAAALLTLVVAVGVLAGPLLGWLIAGWPLRRSLVTVAVVSATVAMWTAVLLWPGPAPLVLLVALVAVLGVNGPASMVGFDYARSFNPASRLGSATGMVNVGGFLASLVTILLVGVVLDLLAPSGVYSLGAFRVAFAVQYAFWAFGLAAVLHTRRAVRRRALTQGIAVDPAYRAVVRRVRALRST